MMRHLINLLLWVLPPTRMFGFRRFALRLSGIDLAEGVRACGRGWVYGRGKLSIGRDTWLSPGVIVHTHVQAPIRIGANCDIGHGVEFVTGSHLIGDHERRAGLGTAARISIGDGTWIGAGSRILGGVSIGCGCVVASGAVVTKDVPDDTLVAGVPAVHKRRLAVG